MSTDRADTTASMAALWAARLAITLVFGLNVHCALSFIFNPAQYLGAYELSGLAGNVAIQGIGVAFLMWNATYPFAIAHPYKHRLVFLIVLIQQTIGLIGESFIFWGIGDATPVLASSILRFIVFDAAGLVIMTAAFIWLMISARILRT